MIREHSRLNLETGEITIELIDDEIPEPTPEEILAAERAAWVVSRFQAKAALYSAGLLDEVEAALAADGNFIHQLAWNEAVEFRRDSPTISHIARAIELDEQSIDDLFRLALSIRA